MKKAMQLFPFTNVAVRIFLVGTFLCVFFGFATYVFAPTLQRAIHHDDPETPPAPSTPPAPPITLTFVGDIMFDRYVREKAQTHGYEAVTEATRVLFASSTYLFGNLEGPITSFAPVSNYRDGGPDHYRFTFATDTAYTLAHTGFSAVTLNNNHILNFGSEGVAETKRWLDANGVGYVGAPDDLYTPWRTATSGRTIAVYSYSPWHTKDVVTLRTRISEEATSTLVVVLAHWGDEYEKHPNQAQTRTAHQLVDAGADLVIGSHPHVIQDKEIYANALIYYSLGNFVFDQYFSQDVRCGAVVSYTILPDDTATTSELFISLRENGTIATSSCATSVPVLST